jgi:hypothetical protein
MTTDTFTAFFFDTLDKQIPTDARDGIHAYWNAFRVEPRLILNDAEVDSEFGAAPEVAAVGGRGCLHHFAFRQFIVEHAPEHVARTIIQHELIHCYLDRSNTPAKLFAEIMLRAPTYHRSMDLISQSIAKAKQAIRSIAAYNAEEPFVSAINTTWGGNDYEARQWIQQHH